MVQEHSTVTQQNYFWNMPQKEDWDQPITLLEDVNNKSPDPGCGVKCSEKYQILFTGKSCLPFQKLTTATDRTWCEQELALGYKAILDKCVKLIFL